MVVVLSEKDRREIFDTLTDEQMRVVKKYVLYEARSRLLSRYFWKGINWELVRLEYDPLFKKSEARENIILLFIVMHVIILLNTNMWLGHCKQDMNKN